MMMRMRIGAQGFTVVALLAGIFLSAAPKKAAVQAQDQDRARINQEIQGIGGDRNRT